MGDASSGSSLTDTKLGPFEVYDVIGTGAMGVVLSGIHPEHRVPVAIKAITDESAADRRFRQQLRDEVQAAAALNHPGVVTVLDYGETDRAIEQLSDGRVPGGTPYFVMERTRKGTLSEYVGRLTWWEAKKLLLDVLDAIAHAHASDLIHRDIKPANILLAQWGGRLIPKLADFGIAFAIDGGSTMTASVGTPRYMAPEQIEQPWRKHGPWSDLYSVGCVAFELVSGDKLFDARNLDEIYQQHFRATHPPVDPVVPVPEGFQQWLDRMLTREPEDRFQTAAEAACRLADLAPPDETGELDDPIGSEFARLTPVLDPVLPDQQDQQLGADDSTPQVSQLPADWPQPTLKPLPIRMAGAGLGLFGVRSIPLVGRDEELDRMWRTYKKVDADAEIRVTVVRGSQGCGKTRLVEWFAQRLKEFGAATVLRADHSAEGGAADGLSGMLARHFRTRRATDSEARQLVHDKMGEAAANSPYELETMMQILRPAADVEPDSTGISIATPSQRYAVVSRYLGYLAEQRPVLVWCDDIQWGSDAIEFARFLHENSAKIGPVHIVLVGTNEALAERESERERLENLGELERTEELYLEPLAPVDHERLVEELLMLDGDLAREVVRRTSGNPLFAVELIGDWIQRGLLEVGNRGFELGEGVDPAIPDHLHEVWVQRLEGLLEDYGEDAREALELAAALGQEVRIEEWRAVCDLAGVYLDDSLAAELTERRFANRTEDGWSFAHAILHESIERLAREENRWVRHRRYCANMVEVYYDTTNSRTAERFGRYVMSAHQFERALEPLLRGARGRRRRGEYRAAQQLLSDYLECLECMEVPEEDPRWGEVWVVRARTYLNDDEPRGARRWAKRALKAADRHHWKEIRPHAMGWLALAKQWLGEPDAAEHLQQAYRLLDTASPSDRLRGVYGSVAHGLTSLRKFEQANRLLELDYQEAIEYDDERAVANNHYLRCRHAFLQQDYEDALDYAQTALNRFEHLGHLPGAATCQEFMAEIYRVTGDTEHAERLYRSCLELQDAIGFRKSIAQTNLAAILLKRGRASEAEKLFVLAADAFESSGRRTFRTVALAGLVACASSQQWWGSLEEHLGPIRRFIETTDEAERDLAEHLEFAGDHLVDGGQYGRAREVYELALEQWERLGADERAETIDDKLKRWI